MLRGRVTGRKRDIDGNTDGWASDHTILDMRQYTVKFEDLEVTELTADAIAESMYAQCDPELNQ